MGCPVILTVTTEGVPSIREVCVLYRGILLLLESLPLCGRTALDVGGAEPLLCLLSGGAQWLPSYLGRNRKQKKEMVKSQ